MLKANINNYEKVIRFNGLWVGKVIMIFYVDDIFEDVVYLERIKVMIIEQAD